ncbi:MAG: uncharacterized protein KVP18_001338 [Porospora cf. gigantea A]|uniref:uncharacterized protein n=1 Tax=Porospora cf. gigantea A TaxID=2853593 RepID=UPI00355A6E9E|nr:MAG: hypothetical protein KVP18_001338 [Porospora cf. gigantea A]
MVWNRVSYCLHATCFALLLVESGLQRSDEVSHPSDLTIGHEAFALDYVNRLHEGLKRKVALLINDFAQKPLYHTHVTRTLLVYEVGRDC